MNMAISHSPPPNLLDLPNELLYEIARHAMPESFVEVLLTCRTLYDCTKPLAPLYKSQLKQHSLLEIDACTDRRGILICLNRIAQQPDIARYVRNANLSCIASITKVCRPSQALRQTPPFLEFERVQADQNALADIERLIGQSSCLRAAGIDVDAWARSMLDPIVDITQDQCDCSFDSAENQIFMLCILKNVRTLRIDDLSQGLAGLDMAPDSPQAKVLAAIKAAQQSQTRPADAPLGQLRRFCSLPAIDHQTWQPLEALGFFLTTPSLTELYASSCLAHVDQTGSIFSWPGTMPLHHNLRRIELVAACFDDIGLISLLRGLPNLEIFRHSHTIKHPSQCYDHNPAELFAALGKHVGKTLKHLSMCLEPHFFGTIVNGVVDMSDFTRLETLDVDYRMFYGPTVASGERNGSDNPSLPTRGRGAIWKPSDIPPLATILPPGLQRLEIFLGESPSAGMHDRFDQDASLRALFCIPDVDDLSSLTARTAALEVSTSSATTTTSTSTSDTASPDMQLPPSCTVRCVSRTLTAERPKDVIDLRRGWTRPDQIRKYLEARGVTVHVNSEDDPQWICNLKKRFGTEIW